MAAVLRPLPLGGRVRVYAVGATLAGVAATAVVIDGVVSWVEGLGLVGAYAARVTLSSARWRRTSTPRDSRLNQATRRPASTAVRPKA